MIRALLSAGVNPQPNIENGEDPTLVPLHAAAFNWNLECVKVLVEEGNVDVNVKDDIGGVPLMRAAFRGHPEIARYLLKTGADPRVRQEREFGALEFGAGKGSVEVVRLLQDHSASESIRESAADQKVLGEESKKALAVTLALAGGADSEMWKWLSSSSNEEDIPFPTTTESGKAHSSPLSKRKQSKTPSKEQHQNPHQGPLTPLPLSHPHRQHSTRRHTLPSPARIQSKTSTHRRHVQRRLKRQYRRYRIHLACCIRPPPSPSIKPPTQEIEDEKHQIAHELLFMASQNGALSIAKLLLEDEENGADISFLQAPHVTTSLYVVAAQNHLSVLEYFLENYRGKVDLHAAIRRFANGARHSG